MVSVETSTGTAILRVSLSDVADPDTRNRKRCANLCTMPISTAEKVHALSRDLGSQRRLAELLGVSPAQVTRWRRGGGIDELNAERVDLLELVMANLLRVYSVAAAERWLVGLNPSLGDRRPLDLIRRGQARELLDAIATERAGSYA
jgi:uncharacterized protein (DUF2384 family)